MPKTEDSDDAKSTSSSEYQETEEIETDNSLKASSEDSESPEEFKINANSQDTTDERLNKVVNPSYETHQGSFGGDGFRMMEVVNEDNESISSHDLDSDPSMVNVQDSPVRFDQLPSGTGSRDVGESIN